MIFIKKFVIIYIEDKKREEIKIFLNLASLKSFRQKKALEIFKKILYNIYKEINKSIFKGKGDFNNGKESYKEAGI